MTAQIEDKYMYKECEYSILAIQNNWPFDIENYNVEPVAPHTACWRGYYCKYGIKEGALVLKDLNLCLKGEYPDINGVKAIKESKKHNYFNVYKDVDIDISYTGGIVIAKDFIRDYYIHMGFQRPYGFNVVYELIFNKGELIQERNVSKEMKQIREELALGEIHNNKKDISRFVEESFSLDYSVKWNY